MAEPVKKRLVSRAAERARPGRHLQATSLATLLLCLVLLTCAARAALGDPAYDELPENIPAPALHACSNPTSAQCENLVIYYLDEARAKVAIPPYALPPSFPTLPPAHQLLILSNLDRLAYGLPPILGLSSELNAEAQEAARDDQDPSLSAPAGAEYFDWTGNWAAGTTEAMPNAPMAYYDWVYDDGFGSGNVDCPTPGASGCWGHRRDVLAEFDPEATISMGAGASVGELGVGEGLIGGSFTMALAGDLNPPPPYEYTWADALAEGADSFAYVPHFEVEVNVTVEGGGRGTVSGAIPCRIRYGCSKELPYGVPVTLTATPAPGSQFRGWGEACSGTGACTFTPGPNGATVQAMFVRDSVATHHREITLGAARIDPRTSSARLSFGVEGGAGGLQCALLKSGARARAHFVSCRSPKTYTRLKKGAYEFYVRAPSRRGAPSAPVERAFVIR